MPPPNGSGPENRPSNAQQLIEQCPLTDSGPQEPPYDEQINGSDLNASGVRHYHFVLFFHLIGCSSGKIQIVSVGYGEGTWHIEKKKKMYGFFCNLTEKV